MFAGRQETAETSVVARLCCSGAEHGAFEPGVVPLKNEFQSIRSAFMGSITAARRAGTNAAMAATAERKSAAAM